MGHRRRRGRRERGRNRCVERQERCGTSRGCTGRISSEYRSSEPSTPLKYLRLVHSTYMTSLQWYSKHCVQYILLKQRHLPMAQWSRGKILALGFIPWDCKGSRVRIPVGPFFPCLSQQVQVTFWSRVQKITRSVTCIKKPGRPRDRHRPVYPLLSILHSSLEDIHTIQRQALKLADQFASAATANQSRATTEYQCSRPTQCNR